MTSQSDDENYRENPDSHQDDDDFFENWVPDPNAEEATIEEIVAALDYEPKPRRAKPDEFLSGAGSVVVASPFSIATPEPTAVAAPAPAKPVLEVARSQAAGASNVGGGALSSDGSDDGTAIRRLNKVPETTVDRSNDVTMPEVRRSNKVTAVVVQPASNKVTRKLRRSDSKDRQIIDGIRNSVTSTGPDGNLALVGDFQSSILSTSWEHTGDRVKLAFANEALELHQDDKQESGKRPVSWSLNLGPGRLTEALHHPKGFVSSLAGLINRAFEKRLGFVPFYWFIVDTEKERLHLHGGILASSEQLPFIEEAMRHAGGKWSATPRSAEKHQFHCNPERCDYGWITYAIERKAQVRRIIGSSHTFFIGKSLRKEAGGLYDRYRQILRGEAEVA